MLDVTLTVNGNDYGGWKSIRIARGIEQLAGTFDLGVSELWPNQEIVKNIAPGDACTVTVNGIVAITGFVDDVCVDYGSTTHEVSVRGRDATGDLVDASAIHKSGQWTSAKAETIAANLCAPFKIPVRAEVNTGKADKWEITQGEAVYENLDRLAKAKGVLLVSDGKGGLLITRAGKGGRAPVGLERGVNILRARLELSFKERFSRYIVKGQGASSDWLSGAATRPKAEALDPMIARYRPLIVIPEDNVDGAGMKRRALWEANVRSGKSGQISVTLQGFGHSGGLWQPNTLVHVKDPWLRTDADLLVKGVTFALDDQGGSITELALVLPQAYDLIPMPKMKANSNAWDMFGKQLQQEIEKLKKRAPAK